MAGPGVISFTRTEKYSSLVAEELKEMRDARVFSDFKICVKGESLPCHRLVVSVHSAMMKAMLTSDMAEAAKHSVNLDHIDLGVMKAILDYMYVGQVSFDVDQLSDMIIACDYLRINLLKDFCVDQVSSILQPANAIPWLKIAHKLNLTDVKTHCLQIFVANFSSISKQMDFVDLSIVNVQECLQQARQSSQQQDHVLDASLRWIDRDTTERLVHLEVLMKQIQLNLCSQKGILGAMKTYKTIVNATDSLYDQLTTAAIEMSGSRVERKPSLAIIGGYDDAKDEVNQVCWKLTEDKEVVEMLRIPFDDLKRYHSVCSTPTGFIISGGEPSTLCVMLNADTMKWSELQNLMASRDCHGSIFIRGVLYVLGGYVEGEMSQSVHSLVVEGGRWQEDVDLLNSMSFPKVAELDENIFVLDQDSGHLLHMDVDRKAWTAKASLPEDNDYSGASMTSHNGKLYVAGTDVFAWYSPDTDSWVQGQKPNKRHDYGSLVHHDNKLLLLGGQADEVEEYDFDEQVWSECAWKLPVRLWFHHALVLNIPE